jgi:hypothetical protein
MNIMMRKTLLLILLIAPALFNVKAWNDLRIIDPMNPWYDLPSRITRADITVHPKGAFMEVGMYLNHYYYGIWMGGRNCYGNEYFYGLLTRQTSGNYISLRNGKDLGQDLTGSEGTVILSGPLDGKDFHQALQVGHLQVRELPGIGAFRLPVTVHPYRVESQLPGRNNIMVYALGNVKMFLFFDIKNLQGPLEIPVVGFV